MDFHIHGFKEEEDMEFETIEDEIISTLFFMKNTYTPTQLQNVKSMIDAYPHLDLDYIEQWIPELGLDEIYSKLKKLQN